MGKKDKSKKKKEPVHVSLDVLGKLYRLFAPHYRSNRKMLIFSVVGMALTIALSVALPWALKLIIDCVILSNPLPPDFTFLAAYLEGKGSKEMLVFFVLAFIALGLLHTLTSFFYKVGLTIVGSNMISDFRERVFEHLQRLSLSFHKEWRSGDLVFRLTSDVNEMKAVLIDSPQQLVQRSLSLVFYIGVMLYIDWQLALIAFSAIPFIWLANRFFGKGMQKATKKKKKKESDMSSLIADNVTAMALVQGYGREDLQHEQFSSVNQKSMVSAVKAIKISKIFKRVNEIVIAAGTAVVIYFGGLLVLDDAILPGTLVLFSVYLKNLYSPLDKFSAILFEIAKAQVAGVRLLEIMEHETTVSDAKGVKKAPALQGRVAFKGVTFGYKKDKPIIKEFNGAFEAGENVAIVGHSGSGKSTLMSLLMRFYDPQEGSVLFDGRDAREFTLKSLRSQITILLQDAKLFNQTIYENIAFGKEGATREEVVRAAKLARAHDFIMAQPDGYDTVIAEGGRNLSGGQRQRINIARAMIRNTPIVILDEPTSALDAKTEKEIKQALNALAAGRTTFTITHKFSSAMDAEKIIVLADGKQPASGRHEDLLESNEEYRKLFDVQANLHQSFLAKTKGKIHHAQAA